MKKEAILLKNKIFGLIENNISNGERQILSQLYYFTDRIILDKLENIVGISEQDYIDSITMTILRTLNGYKETYGSLGRDTVYIEELIEVLKVYRESEGLLNSYL